MSGLLLPICSVVFSTLLCVAFFSKKRLNILENNLYSIMIISSLVDSIIVSFLRILAVFEDPTLEPLIVNIFNKIDFSLLIIYTNCLFCYALLISYPKIKNNFFKVLPIFIIIDLAFLIFIFTFNVNIISLNGDYSISGIPSTLTMILCGLYLIFALFIALLNIKTADKRYIPMFSVIGIVAFLIVVFNINPYLIIISITLTFVNFLMYFTIENPDVKMLKELELAKDQAEKANRAKTDFLSSMSHEIRTPLNAIVGLSEIIKTSNDIGEIHEDAADVVSASNTLLEIVNGILDISKIEADKMEIVEVSYNPLEEFKNLVTLTETRIGEKEIELRTDFAVDIPETLYGDKGKVKQIITNLLTNAVKYTEEGYIDFKVSCINEKDVSKLTISVADTGRGIKEDQMDNLFTKFNRLEEDKNTTIEGTGLGLAITKSLVEMMGGKIVVDSTYGEGSKFTVFLSQKMAEVITEETHTEIQNTFDNKKALIVDDNKLNIKVAAKILKEFNLDIEEAMSGFESISKIENGENYDIIFMDIMMPKMSGVETLKRLKQIENFNIPVVALTADAIEGKSNKYIEVGFDDYISKPIDRKELNKVLNKVLNHVEEETKKEYEEDPDIHKVIPITDEQIELLNEKLKNNEKM